MANIRDPHIILMVDDDPNDYYLMNKALSEANPEDNYSRYKP